MHKLRAILLESRYRIQRKFVVRDDQLGGARDDPRGDGFVDFREVFDEGVRDGKEMCVEVLGVVGDYDGGGNNGGEGFGGEVAAGCNGQCLSSYMSKAGGEGDTHVCFRWRLVRLVLTVLYWLYLLLTSLSMLTISWEAGVSKLGIHSGRKAERKRYFL